MVATINSIKHYVQFTNTALASGAATGKTLANAVVAPAVGTSAEVREGSVIKAIYIEFWLNSEAATGAESQFTLIIEKRPSNSPSLGFTDTQNLMAYVNKKNILYVTQGIIGATIDGNGAVPVVRQFFLIPKGKQRMGSDDKIVVTIGAVGAMRVCGFTTYKEYN